MMGCGGWRWFVVVLTTLLVAPALCAEHGAAFKFVGGFLRMDAEREERPNTRLVLHVIGAGFSRTGTKSTESALLRLGHKIYDTRSMLELKHAEQWIEAAHQIKGGNVTLARELLEQIEAKGYTATLDCPMNLFAGTFAALRPEAKVLFTHRDLDKWFDSWMTVNQIMSCFVQRPWTWVVDFTFVGQICKALFDFDFTYPSYPAHLSRPVPWFEQLLTLPAFDPDGSKTHWLAFHERFRSELEASLPPPRFLAFDVREGWVPLLAFLGVSDPALAAEPFPHVNEIESLRVVRKVGDGQRGRRARLQGPWLCLRRGTKPKPKRRS